MSAEAFNSLSRAQQRVAIAKDVLARMDASLLIAGAGSTLNDDTRDLLREQPNSAAVRKAINAHSCTACAKGAMLLSWIGTLNSVEPKDAAEAMAGALDDSFPAPMVALFGHHLLNAIEVAYEQDTSYAFRAATFDEARALVDAFSEHLRPMRLRQIMENLIANDGDLMVSGGPDGTYRFN